VAEWQKLSKSQWKKGRLSYHQEYQRTEQLFRIDQRVAPVGDVAELLQELVRAFVEEDLLQVQEHPVVP
jgi:hypothetical protein